VIQWNLMREVKRLFLRFLMLLFNYKRQYQHVLKIQLLSHGFKVRQMVVLLYLITESTMIKLLEYILLEHLK